MIRLLSLAVLAIGVGCAAFAFSRGSATATTVEGGGWSLTAVAGTGQLRTLTSEVMVFERVQGPGGRTLAAVMPVRVVLGIDLGAVRTRQAPDGSREIHLPPVRVLVAAADPARMMVWEASGPQVVPGERLGLAQILEARAVAQAETECRRLGLHRQAEERAEGVVRSWAVATGPAVVRVVRAPAAQ